MHESLQSMFDLSGKAAVVTGVSRGIGISFARGLAKAGCNLVVAARSIDPLKQSAHDLEQFGTRVVPVQADVCDPAEVEAMIKCTVREFGRIDILVNNAGISAVADAESMSRDQWQSVHRHEPDRPLLLRTGRGAPHAGTGIREDHQHRVDVRHQRLELRFAGLVRRQQVGRDSD